MCVEPSWFFFSKNTRWKWSNEGKRDELFDGKEKLMMMMRWKIINCNNNCENIFSRLGSSENAENLTDLIFPMLFLCAKTLFPAFLLVVFIFFSYTCEDQPNIIDDHRSLCMRKICGITNKTGKEFTVYFCYCMPRWVDDDTKNSDERRKNLIRALKHSSFSTL